MAGPPHPTEFSNLFIKETSVNAKSARSFCFIAITFPQGLRNPKLSPLYYRIV
jgi:hypothetical protein